MLLTHGKTVFGAGNELRLLAFLQDSIPFNWKKFFLIGNTCILALDFGG